MNIFFLDLDPTRAAQAHCDRHVVKMILESTQLLWTAQHVLAGEGSLCIRIDDDVLSRPYKPTHRNHPCAIWARASFGNYMWLCALAAALVTEYHYRYPAGKVHACEAHLRWLTAHPPALLSRTANPLTMPARAMPDEYKNHPSPTACYKAYYLGQKYKQGLLIYTRRSPPHWAEHVAVSRAINAWRSTKELKTTAPSKDRSCRHQLTSSSSPVVARTPI